MWILAELILLVLLGCHFGKTHSETLCKWSNEGCDSSSECCSGECLQAHTGTNYRCTRSSISERCVFDYHCKGKLMCGGEFQCCSPYWQMCVRTIDCCNKEHVCRPAAGFIYKRCLYPSSASYTKVSLALFVILTLACVMNVL